jgi:restriction endonuclease S subunit
VFVTKLSFSIVNVKELKGNRLDAESYSPEVIQIKGQLKTAPYDLLGDLADFKTSAFYEAIALSYLPTGIPFVRVSDVDPSTLTIRTKGLVFLYEGKKVKGISVLSPKDLVVTKGGTIANIAILPTTFPKYWISRDVIGIVPKTAEFASMLLVFLSSKYGKVQLQSSKSQQVQPHLTIQPLREIIVPKFSQETVKKVSELVQDSHNLLEQADANYDEAERLLYKALDVEKLEIEEDLTYIASSKNIEKSGPYRLDANYYQPKHLKNLDLLDDPFTVKRLAEISEGVVDPKKTPTHVFKYVSLSDIDTSKGEIKSFQEQPGWQMPSRAKMLIRSRDVLVSSLKGSIDKIGLVPEKLDGAVASTGFFVLRESKEIYPAELIFLLFRTPIMTLQMQKLASGAILEAVSKRAFKQLKIPQVKHPEITPTIIELVDSYFSLLERSKSLLQMAVHHLEQSVESGA